MHRGDIQPVSVTSMHKVRYDVWTILDCQARSIAAFGSVSCDPKKLMNQCGLAKSEVLRDLSVR